VCACHSSSVMAHPLSQAGPGGLPEGADGPAGCCDQAGAPATCWVRGCGCCPACVVVGDDQAGWTEVVLAAAPRERLGLAGTSLPSMTSFHSFSVGSTTRSSRF